MTTSRSENTIKSMYVLQQQLNDEESPGNKSDEASSNSSNVEDNIIVKTFSERNNNNNNNNNNNKKLFDTNNNMHLLPTLMAQREIDRSKISHLTKKMFKMELESEKEEIKSHYMKLEFGNTTLMLEECKKMIETKTKTLDNYYRKYWIYMTCFILLAFINAFDLLYKYFDTTRNE